MAPKIIIFLLSIAVCITFNPLRAQEHYSYPEIIQCSKCKGLGTIKCKKCKGKGYKEKKGEKIDCSKCDALGYKICKECNGKGAYKIRYCLTCYGNGSLKCSWCDGEGTRGYELITVPCHACHRSKEYTCPSCKGIPKAPLICSKCNNKGKITCTKCDKNGMVKEYQEKRCSHCNGFKKKTCRSCNGKGNITYYILE